MPEHGCLPPRRTGRADFPHPALTQTLAPKQYAGWKASLAQAAKPRSKMGTVPNRTAGFRSGTRVQAEFPPADSAGLRSGPFAPRSLPASPLLWAGPTPGRSRSEVMNSSRALHGSPPCTPPGLPGSSTDLSPCAVPNHPGEPDGCLHPLLHHR